MGSHQHPQDVANLADDFPSPEPTNAHLETMDMSSELANQAAAQAIEQAVAVAVSVDSGDVPDSAHAVAQPTNHLSDRRHLAGSSSSLDGPSRQGSPSLASITYRSQLSRHEDESNSQHHPVQHSRAQDTSQHAPAPSHLQQHPSLPLSNNDQLIILRESYARNPTPDRKELDRLAERTGRPWNKIREYFRQRRNKLRGLRDLEHMDEPGRATGWLQVTYRTAPESSSVSQLNLYNSYRTRFDPYGSHAPLLGGQELIQLVCATFPGCEMAKDSEDYVMRGLKLREGAATGGHEQEGEGEMWERGVDGLVEPLRASTWLLSNFQQQPPETLGSATSQSITQTDLYTTYAARFSSIAGQGGAGGAQGNGTAATTTAADEAELREYEAEMAAPDTSNGADADVEADEQERDEAEGHGGENGVDQDIHPFSLALAGQESTEPPDAAPTTTTAATAATNAQQPLTSIQIPLSPPSPARPQSSRPKREERILNPVELINLTRMTFPKSEPAVDEHGRFVIRGLERREGVEKGRNVRVEDMFPFALVSAPSASDPTHPFTSLLKRKLGMLHPDPDSQSGDSKRFKRESGNALAGAGSVAAETLQAEEKELVQGLRRFRDSPLGREVRDTCVQQ